MVIFHDIENATAKGPADTLHWAAFNIPGTAKGLPEGLASGDLPDGTRNGPGIGTGANTTREDIMKGMEGHVVGKAAYVGRFHRVQ